MNTTNTTSAIATTIAMGPMGMGNTLTLAFANGKTLTVKSDELSADIISQAIMHGLKQKLVDAAAISRNTDTGRPASIEDKYNAVREVYDRLYAGSWNKIRAAGEGKSSGGLLFKALCRMYASKTPEQVRAFLDAKTKEEQAALRKNPRVAEIIETIRAEEAKDNATDHDASDALLAGLEG